MEILKVYEANNGDVFVEHNAQHCEEPTKEDFLKALEHIKDVEVVKCEAVESKSYNQLINYYVDDEFIATSGIHVTDKFGLFSDFVYLKRVADKSKIELMYKHTLKNCGIEL